MMCLVLPSPPCHLILLILSQLSCHLVIVLFHILVSIPTLLPSSQPCCPVHVIIASTSSHLYWLVYIISSSCDSSSLSSCCPGLLIYTFICFVYLFVSLYIQEQSALSFTCMHVCLLINDSFFCSFIHTFMCILACEAAARKPAAGQW